MGWAESIIGLGAGLSSNWRAVADCQSERMKSLADLDEQRQRKPWPWICGALTA